MNAPTRITPLRVRVIGIDPSLAATGFVNHSGYAATIKPARGPDRLKQIAGMVRDLCRFESVDLAILEDLPTNAMGAGLTGMAQGVIRCELERLGIPYATVAPATLKKFATGSGRATKGQMASRLASLGGPRLGDDNQVDAWWLREVGRQVTGHPGRLSMPLDSLLPAAKTVRGKRKMIHKVKGDWVLDPRFASNPWLALVEEIVSGHERTD